MAVALNFDFEAPREFSKVLNFVVLGERFIKIGDLSGLLGSCDDIVNPGTENQLISVGVDCVTQGSLRLGRKPRV